MLGQNKTPPAWDRWRRLFLEKGLLRRALLLGRVACFFLFLLLRLLGGLSLRGCLRSGLKRLFGAGRLLLSRLLHLFLFHWLLALNSLAFCFGSGLLLSRLLRLLLLNGLALNRLAFRCGSRLLRSGAGCGLFGHGAR